MPVENTRTVALIPLAAGVSDCVRKIASEEPMSFDVSKSASASPPSQATLDTTGIVAGGR